MPGSKSSVIEPHKGLKYGDQTFDKPKGVVHRWIRYQTRNRSLIDYIDQVKVDSIHSVGHLKVLDPILEDGLV